MQSELSQHAVTVRPPLDGKRPVAKTDHAAILEQTERILKNPLFTQSKRYPLVLRYLVNHALEGTPDPHLKERTIGVEVLGRGPNYDSNEDPTVRVVIGEIRKRLVHYYLEPGHESEIQIELPLGSYTPEFTVKRPVEPLITVKPRWPRYLFWVVGAAVIACLLLFAGLRLMPSRNALDRFWDPVLRGSPTVILCVGERLPFGTPAALEDRLARQTGSPPATSVKDESTNDMRRFIETRPAISVLTAIALTDIAEFLQPRGSKGVIRVASATTLTDLRQGPAILIGSYNNYWTMHLGENLRYRFRTSNAESLSWIEDKENPSNRDWAVKLNTHYTNVAGDYGLISRVADPSTGHIVVSVAGVTPIGTIAASEFLANPASWEALSRNAPRDWESKNLQIVVAVKVINGNAGPPNVLATYFW